MKRARSPWLSALGCCLLVSAAVTAGDVPAPEAGGTPKKGTKEAYLAGSVTGRDKGSDLVKTGQFYFPRLQFQCHEDVPDKWDVHPIGDQNLREQIKKLTNINILTDPVVVNLDRMEEMCRYPFVFMTAEGTFTLSDTNIATMREYLLRGGFLFADDCVLLGKGDLFFRSFVEQMKRVFPDNPMRPVPAEHEIFNCFFTLKEVPHMQGVKHPGMGLFDKETGRLMALCTSGDLHCAWVGFESVFGAENRQKGIQMSVNIVVYCLTH
ncbi:MAG: DUF4159 domain-containing protein [Planctomycetota bacterium]|nr:DUF4159 domain-containing protein [Planctomycetota bacterium]